jgi:GTPase involved in cell partitioning and DNA repair
VTRRYSSSSDSDGNGGKGVSCFGRPFYLYTISGGPEGGKRLGGRFIDRVGLAASAVNAVLTAHVAV